ncbi:MAG: pantetheine-phosphate adenylyltransferase [Thermodesulfobacteriota bacterium]|nr:MAG: pantetheine-phosphate adenylyltransferase [Thermodesulfobacteriota bacterium]
MARHIAIYPGTFDPITRGHLDIIQRGLNLFDALIVAVAESTSKKTLFDVSERLDIIRRETKSFKNLKVESFNTLLIDYARQKKVKTVLRGLRVISDFEYEFQMALTNRKLAPGIETVFMMTAENYAPISSRFIKEIARLGGDTRAFVSPRVSRKLKEKFSKEGAGRGKKR